MLCPRLCLRVKIGADPLRNPENGHTGISEVLKILLGWLIGDEPHLSGDLLNLLNIDVLRSIPRHFLIPTVYRHLNKATQ
jgi:hypothetical protein